MPFAKIKTDVFANAKVRRLTDEAFRAWVYLLTQAWEESPNKKAGSITFRGVCAEDADRAKLEVGRLIASAAACDDDTERRHLIINELTNVGMIHVSVGSESEALSQDFVVGTGGTTFWDIVITMHDWDYHNPRQPPSHTTDGERERKRNYRAQQRNGPNGVPRGQTKVSQPDCPNGPTTDPDKDRDPDQDLDRQTTNGAEPGWLAGLRRELGTALGWNKPLGVGRDPARVIGAFARWEDRGLHSAVIAECTRLAAEKGVTPKNLAWFAGWLDTVPDARLGA